MIINISNAEIGKLYNPLPSLLLVNFAQCRFRQKALTTLEAVRKYYPKSLSFYSIELTRELVNVIPELRGTPAWVIHNADNKRYVFMGSFEFEQLVAVTDAALTGIDIETGEFSLKV